RVGQDRAHGAKLLTPRVIANQDGYGLGPRRVVGRGTDAVCYDPEEGVQGHWVLGMPLGQLEELRRQLLAFGVYLLEDLQAFLIGLGLPESVRVGLHGVLERLEQRLILLRRRGRLSPYLLIRPQRRHGKR